MARAQICTTLEATYARLLSDYASIEKEVEGVVGLQAILNKIDEIQERQKRIRRQLAAIEIVIHIWEPDWDRSAIRPVKGYKLNQAKGSIATACYTLLRKEPGPFVARETAHRVIAMLVADGLEAPPILSVDVAVRGLFNRLEGKGVRRIEGTPISWMRE